MVYIGMNPYMIDAGGFVLSWHGFFAFLGVVVAVVLVTRWGPTKGVPSDDVYGTAIWAIIGGIVGARLVHVIDRWDYYGDNLIQAVELWNGGIALLGSIIGGFIAGAIYARLQGYPIGKLADLAAPALLIAQTIGRIGDVINGEHVSKVTDLSWGFVYSHPLSLSNQVHGLMASHPTVLYEMIWNMLVLSVVWPMRDRIKPDGMLFAMYIGLYAFGRFFISFLREDKVWFAGLQEAHLICIALVVISVPLLVYKGQIVSKD